MTGDVFDEWDVPVLSSQFRLVAFVAGSYCLTAIAAYIVTLTAYRRFVR